MVAPVITALMGTSAAAGIAAALGTRFAAPWMQNVAILNRAGGRAIIGALIAWAGVAFFDDYARAIVVGFGAALFAEGLFAIIFPNGIQARA